MVWVVDWGIISWPIGADKFIVLYLSGSSCKKIIAEKMSQNIVTWKYQNRAKSSPGY